MSNVQIMGLEAARTKMLRARKEFEAAKLREVAYRGVHYDIPNRPEDTPRGTFVYRGRTYTK